MVIGSESIQLLTEGIGCPQLRAEMVVADSGITDVPIILPPARIEASASLLS